MILSLYSFFTSIRFWDVHEKKTKLSNRMCSPNGPKVIRMCYHASNATHFQSSNSRTKFTVKLLLVGFSALCVCSLSWLFFCVRFVPFFRVRICYSFFRYLEFNRTHFPRNIMELNSWRRKKNRNNKAIKRTWVLVRKSENALPGETWLKQL